MPHTIKILTQTEYQALSNGLLKYCAASTFTIGGQSYTTPQVVTLIGQLQNATVTAATSKSAWKEARAAIVAAEAAEGKTVRGVRDVVALMFNNAPTVLTELAIQPRKMPKPLSAAARAAATAKADATRKARGTTSKKQKATVTGNVTGVQIIPVTAPGNVPAPAAPSASTPAQPAAAGGSTTPATAPAAAATPSGSTTPAAAPTLPAPGTSSPHA